MPFKDPEKKKRYMRQWRKDAIASGYGKVIYGRRRVKFENEQRYREAVEDALALLLEGNPEQAKDVLGAVLIVADKAVYEQQEREKKTSVRPSA